MKRRIVLWATIGLITGGVWVAYAFATVPDYEQSSAANRVLVILAYATCPIVIAGPRFYLVPLANAATYALLGLTLELIRKK
jgi:hypothetical protein